MNHSFDDTVPSGYPGDFESFFEEDTDFYGLLKSLADQWETMIPKSTPDDKTPKESCSLRKRSDSDDSKEKRSPDDNETGSSRYGLNEDSDWDDMENPDLFRPVSDSVSLDDIESLRKRVQEGETHYTSELAYALINYSSNLDNHLTLEETLAMLNEAYQLFYGLYKAGEPEYLLDCGKIMLQKTGMYLTLSENFGDDFSMDTMNDALAWIKKYQTTLSTDDYLWLSAEAARVQGVCFSRRHMYNSAITSLLQSEKIWCDLVDSGNLQYRIRQAEILHITGIMYANIGDMVQAKTTLLHSNELWTILVEEDPVHLSDQINVYCALARICLFRDESIEVKTFLNTAFDLLKDLKEIDWDKYVSAAIDLYGIQAELQNNTNDYENELDTLEALHQIYLQSSRLKDNDCSSEIIEKECRFYAWLHERRGMTLCILKRYDDALAAYTRSLRFAIDGRKRSGMDIDELLMRLVLNVNWLFQIQGKNDDAIRIMRLVIDLFEKDQAAKHETRQRIRSLLYHQYAKLLLHAEHRELAFEMYNRAIAFLDEEPDRNPANNEMEAIRERATHFSFRELNPEKALSDLANLSSLLEFDIDENDFSKLVLYISVVQGRAKILNQLGRLQETFEQLQTAGQRLLAILEKGHVKDMEYYHNLLVDWVASREATSSREEALALCNEIIQRFRDIQKPYTSEVSLCSLLHHAEFMTTLAKVPISELRSLPPHDTTLSTSEREKISAVIGSGSPELLLMQKRYIANLFDNNILSLSLLKYRLEDSLDNSMAIANQLRDRIDQKMERFQSDRQEMGAETLFFIHNYTNILIQNDRFLEALEQLNRWIDRATLTPEGDIDPTFNPEVRALFAIQEGLLLNSPNLDPDEVIALWDKDLSWCLTCFRDGSVHAGFEYGTVAGNKCTYLESIDRKDLLFSTLNKACQVLEMAALNGHSDAKREWGKLLYRQGYLIEDSNKDEAQTLYLKAYDQIYSNVETLPSPEMCWYLGKITSRLGFLFGLENNAEQSQLYYNRAIDHFKNLIIQQPEGEHEDEFLELFNKLYYLYQQKNMPSLNNEMSVVLYFMYDCMSQKDKAYFSAHSEWYIYLGVFGLFFLRHQLTYSKGDSLMALTNSVFDPWPENCPEETVLKYLSFKTSECYFFIQRCEPERAKNIADRCELILADLPNAGNENGFLPFIEFLVIKLVCFNETYNYKESQKLYHTYSDAFSEAFFALQERYKEEPDSDYSSPETNYIHFLLYGSLAIAYNGEFDEATHMIDQILQSIHSRDITDEMSINNLSTILEIRAQVALLQQDYETALQMSNRAIELNIYEGFDMPPFFLDEVSNDLIQIRAVSLWKTGQTETALELCDQLIKKQDKYWDTGENFVRQFKAKALIIRGDILKEIGQKKDAKEAYDQAKAILQDLVNKGEKHQKYLLDKIK